MNLHSMVHGVENLVPERWWNSCGMNQKRTGKAVTQLYGRITTE